jgi:ribosomal protein S18 acetylase RimI-like enzyme
MDAKAILDIAIPSFLDAHGHSASKREIEAYVKSNFSLSKIKNELSLNENIFFLAEVEKQICAYSKISLNKSNENIQSHELVKLERLYVHPRFYGKGIAPELLEHNIAFSKRNDQKGMWLHVWTENKRAISFYRKMGFKVVGDFNFKISESHYNPNFVMFLAY